MNHKFDMSKMGKRKEVLKGLKENFNIQIPNDFLDSTMIMLGKIEINMFKFDDWLHEKHGNYEDKNKSMSDIIMEKYGKKAHAFFCKYAGM